MRTKYKPWAKPYIEEHPEVMLTIEQLKAIQEPILLEIGSGKGQFLLDMAKNYPTKSFIGVERNVTCCGFAAKKLVDEKINNAKLMFENADLVLDSLKDDSVEILFLNFSDPWPKRRHAKRRLTAPSYLVKYHRVLNKKGQLIIKTDNHDLFLFTLETLKESPLEIVSTNEDYQDIEEFDAMTEYEKSFREKGQPIYRIKVKNK